ncbi:MAG: polyisoprenoid-binding protein YceI [Bacteroidia bacterium]|jgi:polyisoprenoid-binding protein YceI
MRSLLFSLLAVFGTIGQANAQAIYITESSTVSFFSATPIEDIEAVNDASTSLLNVPKSEIAFRIPITGFQFEKPLMQEHFNENYMDTEKYPIASFKGKLSSEIAPKKDTIYNLTATGIMTIHGVDKEQTYNGIVVCKDGKATLNCDFTVILKDYKIKVPKVVFANIAEVIEVKTEFIYKPYEKKK